MWSLNLKIQCAALVLLWGAVSGYEVRVELLRKNYSKFYAEFYSATWFFHFSCYCVSILAVDEKLSCSLLDNINCGGGADFDATTASGTVFELNSGFTTFIKLDQLIGADADTGHTDDV